MTTKTPSSTRVPRHEPALDGIRAVGALMIASTHLIPGLRAHGVLGVSLFFALSGLLIVTLLLSGMHEPRDALAFWDRRFRRLVPAAVLLVGGVVLATAIQNPWPAGGMFGDALSVFTYTANFRFLAEGQINPVRLLAPLEINWTLAIEEQFYLLIPGLVLLARRGRDPKRTIAIGLGVITAASFLAGWLESGYRSELLHTEVRLAELGMGSLLAVAMPEWDTARLRLGRIQLARWAPPIAALGVPALWYFWRTESAWPMDWGLPLVSAVSTCLVVAALTPGPLQTFLRSPPLVACGKVSYGIYLYHWPVLLGIKDHFFGGSQPLVIGTRIALTATLAIASYRLIEQPIRNGSLLRGRSFYFVWGASMVFILIGAWLVQP